jgi:hypothetical protein
MFNLNKAIVMTIKNNNIKKYIMNNELRENEINRDYYLKRAIIYLLIFTTSPFLVVGDAFLFFLIHEIWEEKIKNGVSNYRLTPEQNRNLEFAKTTYWVGVICLGLLITLLPLALTIYHFYKSWKAYKVCQELVHLTLTAETATESEAEREREREREREQSKFVGW